MVCVPGYKLTAKGDVLLVPSNCTAADMQQKACIMGFELKKTLTSKVS